ncbi:MAG: hypothetical protein ABFQ95_02365 [Pseudomonadota bacterium]
MSHNHKSYPLSRNFFHACLVLGVLALAGCSFFKTPEVWINTVSLVVDQDANDNSATKVDVIIIYQEGLLDKLMGLSAGDYFRMSDQIRSDNPGALQVFRWEVAPGQCLFDVPVNITKSLPVGGIVFARYLSEDPHRIRLGKDRDIQIHLRRKDFSIEPRVKKQ